MKKTQTAALKPTFKFAGETYTFGDIMYRGWVAIFQKLSPVLDPLLSSGHFSLEQLFKDGADILPEVAQIILSAATPHKDWTLEQVEAHATPFNLTAMIAQFIAWSGVIDEMKEFTQDTLPALIKAAAFTGR